MKDFILGFVLALFVSYLAIWLMQPIDDAVYRVLRDWQGQLVGDK